MTCDIFPDYREKIYITECEDRLEDKINDKIRNEMLDTFIFIPEQHT